MHRLPLVLCFLALLASALFGTRYVRVENAKRALEQELADATARAAQFGRDIASANERNQSLQTQLDAHRSELAAAKNHAARTEGRLAERERELESVRRNHSAARDAVSIYETTARALASEIATLREELATTRESHASPELVASYKATIAELERQLATVRDGAAAPTTSAGSTAVFTSRAGRATILAVGPANAFVVLNFGEERGAQLGQKMSISHGTNEVATVLISDVRPQVSIAQVLPDTLRGVLQKGDLAVLIR